MNIEDKLNPLLNELRQYASPLGAIRSLFVVGSYSSGYQRPDSDLDLVLVLADEVSTKEVIELGKRLRTGLSLCFSPVNILLFESPFHDRPDLFPKGGKRIHVILHRERWARKSIAEANWVFMSWSKSYMLLIGEDLLKNAPEPKLNDSIVDTFDGIPAIIKMCDSAILLYDPEIHKDYLEKICAYSLTRIRDVVETFPEVKVPLPKSYLGAYSALEKVLYVRDHLIKLRDSIEDILSR